MVATSMPHAAAYKAPLKTVSSLGTRFFEAHRLAAACLPACLRLYMSLLMAAPRPWALLTRVVQLGFLGVLDAADIPMRAIGAPGDGPLGIRAQHARA